MKHIHMRLLDRHFCGDCDAELEQDMQNGKFYCPHCDFDPEGNPYDRLGELDDDIRYEWEVNGR